MRVPQLRPDARRKRGSSGWEAHQKKERSVPDLWPRSKHPDVCSRRQDPNMTSSDADTYMDPTDLAIQL